MPPSLSELTPIILITELTHLGSEAIYYYLLFEKICRPNELSSQQIVNPTNSRLRATSTE